MWCAWWRTASASDAKALVPATVIVVPAILADADLHVHCLFSFCAAVEMAANCEQAWSVPLKNRLSAFPMGANGVITGTQLSGRPGVGLPSAATLDRPS
jgi:hypothetical protein